MSITKGERKYSIPVLVILIILCWPLAIVYAVVKNKGTRETAKSVGEHIKIAKDAANDSKYDSIKKLQELKKSGAITSKEYEEEKKKLLSK